MRAPSAGDPGRAAVGQFLPPQVWRTVSKPLISQLHKGGDPSRPKLTPEQRELLVEPHLEDIALLEEVTGESFEEWRTYREGNSFESRRAAADLRQRLSVVTRSWAPSGRASSR